MAVLSDQIYSPQNFVGEFTGKYYVFDGDNDIDTIHKLFRQNGIETEEAPLWDYPLSEIDHIVENDLDVVLVDCMVWNEQKHEFEHTYRWFEVRKK